MHTIVIESDRDYARIQELAEREGKSVADVVTDLVDEKLETETTLSQAQQEQADLAERLIAIGRRTAPHWTDPTPHGDLLYDEDGLPK